MPQKKNRLTHTQKAIKSKNTSTYHSKTRSVSKSDIESCRTLVENYPRRVDWYKIGKNIGSGSFGEVFRPKKIPGLVVKLVSFKKGESSKKEFYREGLFAASLKYPSVARTYKYFVANSNPLQGCLIMKWYPMSLKQFTKKYYDANTVTATNCHQKWHKKMTTIWAQIVCGVHYLHLKGLVYLDLKPDNVLCNSRGNVFLTDFGLSQCVGKTKLCEKCKLKDLCKLDNTPNCTTSSAGTRGYFSYGQAYQRMYDDRQDFGFASDYWTVTDILWGLLPSKNLDYLSQSPFRPQTKEENDDRGVSKIINFVKSTDPDRFSQLYGYNDPLRIKVLQQYPWLTTLFRDIFSESFVTTWLFPCLTPTQTQPLVVRLLRDLPHDSVKGSSLIHMMNKTSDYQTIKKMFNSFINSS